jgi:hypothetical protein
MEPKNSFKSQELQHRLSSKHDFIRYFEEIRKYLSNSLKFYCSVQYYLPPSSMLTKDFLRQVLTEEKRLLKVGCVRRVNMPRYDELSVKNLFPKFANDPEFMSLMPDRLPKGKTVDREYFFNCLNTVRPDYVKDMVDHANNLRFKAGQKNNEMDEIKVSDHWWDELNSMPFISRK